MNDGGHFTDKSDEAGLLARAGNSRESRRRT